MAYPENFKLFIIWELFALLFFGWVSSSSQIFHFFVLLLLLGHGIHIQIIVALYGTIPDLEQCLKDIWLGQQP